MFTNGVVVKVQQILANKTVLESQLAKLTNDIAVAKLRLSLKDDVDNFLTKLEYNFQKKTISSFENLLTEIINDVLPRENQKVALELSTSRNLSSLYIYLSQNGFKEDVLTGQGGAVANILSTALRFITLVRSQNRKFIVLDEPDCWISPDRVGSFSYVIDKISKELGVQVIYISHHDPSILTGRYIHFSLIDNQVAIKSQLIDEYGSIKQIRLANFMSHKDTLLELSNNTIITGDNNIGKSAVVSAIRAVAYGESNDTYIRHNEESALIEIVFNDGYKIKWQRFLKGKIKVQYDLIDSENNIVKTATTVSVPEWVSEKLGIVPIDGIDVQLNSQKHPIFLLDETPSKRAEILSLGQESKYINSMRQIWKRQIDEDKKTVKLGEIEVTKLNSILKAIQDAELESAIDKINTDYDYLQQLKANIELCKNFIRQISDISDKTNILSDIKDIIITQLPEIKDTENLERVVNLMSLSILHGKTLAEVKNLSIPAVPQLNNTDESIRLINSINNSESVINLFENFDIKLPIIPDLTDTTSIISTGRRLQQLRKILQNFDIPALPQVPEIINSDTIEKIMDTVKQGQELKKQIDFINNDVKTANEKIDNLFAELGVCPLCGQPVTNLHTHKNNFLMEATHV